MGSLANWPAQERPREKLIAQGPDSLSDMELLAVLLGVASAGKGTVLDLSQSLLGRFGGLSGVEAAGIGELTTVPGVGPVQACKLRAAFSLSRRILAGKARKGEGYRNGADVYKRYGPLLAGLKKEIFIALPLDARNRPMGEVRVAEGTLCSCPVHPREAFIPLIRESAAATIFVHNHPSGDPSPSSDDIALTLRLREVGELIGIKVLDHVIVADEGYVSLAEKGYLS